MVGQMQARRVPYRLIACCSLAAHKNGRHVANVVTLALGTHPLLRSTTTGRLGARCRWVVQVASMSVSCLGVDELRNDRIFHP